MKLRRFWFRFSGTWETLPLGGAAIGAGVTAIDRGDAVELLRRRMFDGKAPPIAEVIEDVDVSTLDRHVRPNMGDVTRRGVWFPLGYDEPSRRLSVTTA